MSVGFDHIDLKECAARGIAVGNTPGYDSCLLLSPSSLFFYLFSSPSYLIIYLIFSFFSRSFFFSFLCSVLTETTAELTVALLLAAARRLPEVCKRTGGVGKGGEWERRIEGDGDGKRENRGRGGEGIVLIVLFLRESMLLKMEAGSIGDQRYAHLTCFFSVFSSRLFHGSCLLFYLVDVWSGHIWKHSGNSGIGTHWTCHCKEIKSFRM